MGADLYIASEYDSNYAKWEPVYSHWVKRRDKLWKAGKEKEARKAGEKVFKYFDRMLSKGYFRDSYGGTNLLSRFGIRWWLVVDKFIVDERWMIPEKAAEFLRLLSGREQAFEAALKDEPRRKYYIRRYAHLKAFLKQAITKYECIRCSV